MNFQRVIGMYIKGTTWLGQSLDLLHSKELDADGIKKWVKQLSTCSTYSYTDPDDGVEITFHDMFMDDLLRFCIAVASCDGDVSDKQIAFISWLLDDGYDLDRDFAQHIVDRIESSKWMDEYPLTFMMLVMEFGEDNDHAIEVVGEISRFYYQLARLIRSIDGDGSIAEGSELNTYLDAYEKYVERVSAIGFRIPRDENSIKEVLASWNKLVAEEDSQIRANVVGVWRPASGNAFDKGGLSMLVLEENGKGKMLRKKLFGSKEIALTWELSDALGGEPFPAIFIPSMKTWVLLTPIETGRMMAIVKSVNPKFNDTMGIYHRVYNYEMR